jgi:hypothetical protein
MHVQQNINISVPDHLFSQLSLNQLHEVELFCGLFMILSITSVHTSSTVRWSCTMNWKGVGRNDHIRLEVTASSVGGVKGGGVWLEMHYKKPKS